MTIGKSKKLFFKVYIFTGRKELDTIWVLAETVFLASDPQRRQRSERKLAVASNDEKGIIHKQYIPFEHDRCWYQMRICSVTTRTR